VTAANWFEKLSNYSLAIIFFFTLPTSYLFFQTPNEGEDNSQQLFLFLFFFSENFMDAETMN